MKKEISKEKIKSELGVDVTEVSSKCSQLCIKIAQSEIKDVFDLTKAVNVNFSEEEKSLLAAKFITEIYEKEVENSPIERSLKLIQSLMKKEDSPKERPSSESKVVEIELPEDNPILQLLKNLSK